MKLIYRGITYERHPSETPKRSSGQVRSLAPTEIPDSLAIHQSIYRGVTYYKFSHQEITFLVNAR
ncbi:hypothetical protein C7B80_26445 [Cyanosarcina cf. burmensis CCALA 770]|nr:hypothetical protein C7B80_26445 [Cyanosarcina cf. burmensis CCALA 770]